MKKRKQLHPRVLVSAVILLVLAVLALWKAGGILSSRGDRSGGRSGRRGRLGGSA